MFWMGVLVGIAMTIVAALGLMYFAARWEERERFGVKTPEEWDRERRARTELPEQPPWGRA